jgi:RHS repeat-associated protein
LLSAEPHWANRDASGESSYGRSLFNFFRTYDPITGRYLEADPIGWTGGPNPFVYAGNRPTMFIDPFGLYTEVHFWSGVGNGRSSFGHTDIDVNGTTYSFGPGGATEQPTSEWTERQTGFRSGQGIGLGLTAEEEQKLIDCLSKWRGQSYSPLGNNCTDPPAECLRELGYPVPRPWLPERLRDWLTNSPQSPGRSSVDYPARGGEAPRMPWSPRF